MQPETVLNNYLAALPSPNYCNNKAKVHCGLNIDAWRRYEPLIAQTDPTLVDQLDCGFDMGIDTSKDINIPVKNHKSAYQDYKVVDSFIIKHYQDGSIIGPFKLNPLPVVVKPSPLQVVTSSSGKQRPVVDMSYPKGTSINDAITSDWNQIGGFEGEFKLPTHDDLCKVALTVKDPVMFVVDMKSYYMQLPSEWASAPLMALTWRDCLFIHRRLPFGCRSSCLHAQRVTDAMCRIHKSNSKSDISGYVDDFGSIVALLRSSSAFQQFRALAKELGVLETLDKLMVPDKIRVFLGLLYNLCDMTLSLPDDKLSRAIDMLQNWLEKEDCTEKQVQSLLGHLNHVTTVIHAGRPFTSRFIDILKAKSFPAVITPDLKQDIETWIGFLRGNFAKKSIIKSYELVNADVVLKIQVKAQTFVIWCKGQVQAYQIAKVLPSLPTHAVYAVAMWKACVEFSQIFVGTVVKVTVPSQAAAMVINRARTPCLPIRPMLRKAWMLQATCDYVIRAVVGDNSVHNLYDEFHVFQEVFYD